MGKTDLLVIDDDPDLCELIDDVLSDSYQIHTCTDASNAAALIKAISPPIILLDINLPDENGLRLCKKFSRGGFQEPLTLLISGDNSLELHLEAYNHGGSDFLAKPFKISELRHKVDTLNSLFMQRNQLETEKQYSPEKTQQSVVEVLRYDEVLRFYNAIFDAENIEDIKDCFFKLMNKFGLQCSIQMRVEDTYTFDNMNNQCIPIEEQIYENMHETERFISFPRSIMINGRFSSMIVKNLPSDETTNNTSMRHILSTLVDSLDTKLLALQRANLLRQTSRELAESSDRLINVAKNHDTFICEAKKKFALEVQAQTDKLHIDSSQRALFESMCDTLLAEITHTYTLIGTEAEVLDCLRLSLAVVLNDLKE